MRCALLGIPLVIIAACGDNYSPAPTNNVDAGVSDSDSGTSGNPAPPTPCTDIPGECGTQKCEGGKLVLQAAKDLGSPCTGGFCDGKGACSLGRTCETNAECPTSFCADGVCCQEACTGECKACNIEGSKGLCKNLAFLREDTSYENASGTKVNCTSAVGGARCNGSGKCLKTRGTTCVTDESCMGGRCSGSNKCLGAPGELCDALADCVSNQCSVGTCK